MAAYSNGNSNSFIRVRLYFDYPPPAVIDSRMCWLLVDMNTCRVVADLESIIKDKFEFSRGSILNLFIDDCYLPHTESIYVVRDNDSVRVKVHCLTEVNGHSSCPDKLSKNCKKRRRPTEEDDLGGHVERSEFKEKKWKKLTERGESLEEGAKQASDDKKNKMSQGNIAEENVKKKKKKKRKNIDEDCAAVIPKPATSSKNIPTRLKHSVKITKKPSATQANTKTVSSSDSSSSSKTPSKTKPITSSSPKCRTKHISKCQEAPSVLQPTNCTQKQAASAATSPDVVEPCNAHSGEEFQAVKQQLTERQAGSDVGSQWLGKGCGRGKNWHGGPGEREGGGYSNSFEFSYSGANEPSYQTDSLTNVSVVLKNGAESAPKPDYSSMPLLAAPPQVGQKIAFKLLELTENYTPEVSEYKEGKLLSFDPTTKQIELELLHVSQAPAEPGKFDLVYQNPDGSETVEYAVSREAWVTERWDSLLEPRLII
ncbi:Coilin Sphere organelles protein SPH-1 [Channa argus]|uniref:Coilin Sphere organelles protein SPH-1 n=1 Tax=Channa argus TaxID=215402 RepID=A0A6G1QAN3_CHAAH|nr:Coilin Sphere organelles protein SPH-1 [Channa argus]